MAVNPHVARRPTETPFTATVRFRTIGDATCTAAVESSAATVADILAENRLGPADRTGANTRADDRISEAGMEDRKRQGYF